MNLHAPQHSERSRLAFTLIELLTVIAIIGVVAGLLLSLAGASSRVKVERRVKAELEQLVTAIESYKVKYGSYPPSNPFNGPANAQWNSLFYELTGVQRAGPDYVSPMQPGVALTYSHLTNYFGVPGIVHSAPNNAPEPFVRLSPNSLTPVTNGTPAIPAVLVIKVPGDHPNPGVGINTWKYRVRPRDGHNPKTYDLWAEIKGDKPGVTNIIGNWQ